MTIYPCASDSTDIETNIEPVRLHKLGQQFSKIRGQGNHLKLNSGRDFGQGGNVLIGQDHQMAGIIGVNIHYRKSGLTPVDYIIFTVMARVTIEVVAEDAPFFFFLS